MKVTFLGTGTSQGVPVIGCKCNVCTSIDTRDNRLRSSIWIEINNTSVVIDSGPDFRQQMLRADVNHLDALVYTHEHKDHVAGMDDVRAYNQMQNKAITIWSNKNVEIALKRDFHYAFTKSSHGGLPKVELQLIDEQNDFEIGGIIWSPIPLMHAQMPVLGFRVGDFAYLTDVNFIPDESFLKLEGVKVLVISALRKKKHPSHFSLDQVLEVVKRINPNQTYLTHMSHFIGSHDELDAELPDGVNAAWDGLTIVHE